MKMKRMGLLALTLAATLLCASFAMAAEIIAITDSVISETRNDLVVDFVYPAFKADDEALTEALDFWITQTCQSWYDILYKAQADSIAERTEDLAKQYEDDADFYDTLTAQYEVISMEGGLLQIVTDMSLRLAPSNGEQIIRESYIFDLNGMRLLLLDDLFEGEPIDIYKALSEAAKPHVDALDNAFDDASLEVTGVTTAYYVAAHDGAYDVHLLIDSDVISPDAVEIVLPADEIPLTPIAIADIPMDGTEAIADMPNPMTPSSKEAIHETLGIDMHVPETADATYYLFDFGDPIAEVQFTNEGVLYILDAQKSTEFIDLSGMFIAFDTSEESRIGEMDVTLRLNEGAEGVCTWYDAQAGISYSLVMTEGATLDTLSAMATTLIEP